MNKVSTALRSNSLSCIKTIRHFLYSATVTIFLYYIVDVSSSSVSIAVYYRTSKALNNYVYFYNQVIYPFLFSITIWTVYFLRYLFKGVKNRWPVRKRLPSNPILDETKEEEDDDESKDDILMDDGDIPLTKKNNKQQDAKIYEFESEEELPLLQDIRIHFKIYFIMAMSDTLTGMLILPAILYLPSVDVLLFGRVVLLFNMLFSYCVFKRRYTIIHYIAVLVLFVGVAFAVYPQANLDMSSIGSFFNNSSLSKDSSGEEESTPLSTSTFIFLIFLMLVVEIMAAASSVYKEHVLQKHNKAHALKKHKLQPLRVVAIVSTIQFFLSSPTILLLLIPLPPPWFTVSSTDMGPYIVNATNILIMSLYSPSSSSPPIANYTEGILHTMANGKVESHTTQQHFASFYFIYLVTNVLANIVDIVFIQEVSSTFNIIVNVSVIVVSVFSLSCPWLAGEARNKINGYDGLALFFIVIATVLFKSASSPEYDTVDPAKKTAIFIRRKSSSTLDMPIAINPTREYKLQESVKDMVFLPATTLTLRKVPSKESHPFGSGTGHTTSSSTFVHVTLETTPRRDSSSASASQSASEAEETLINEEDDDD